jgi:hypothetical protein
MANPISMRSILRAHPRDHDHDGLASGTARGQLLEAVENLRNQPGHPGVGHAAGVETSR